MATLEEIADVRQNIHEPDDDDWTDENIIVLVDAHGVNKASAIIWRKKASGYAELVNVSEAGSSLAMSDLHKQALRMAEAFEEAASLDGGGGSGSSGSGPKVKTIVRGD